MLLCSEFNNYIHKISEQWNDIHRFVLRNNIKRWASQLMQAFDKNPKLFHKNIQKTINRREVF